MRELRFGICGLGFMGRTHYAHLHKHPHAHVVAVCDTDPRRRTGDWTDGVGNIAARGAEHASFQDVRSYGDALEMLADDRIDAVAITLPTPMHAAVTVAAARHGKHVFCEKPMALALADCDRMIQAAEAAERTLMIGQCIRFWPQYETIKRIVDAGGIGPVRFASLRRRASAPDYSAGNWLLDGRKSGGALFDLHVHDIDFAQHLLGIPASIAARGCAGPSGRVDHVSATWSYSNGCYAVLEGGWVFRPPWPFEMAITVHGDDGTLDWNSLHGTAVLHYQGEDEPRRIACDSATGWSRELDYFISCLRGGTRPERCLPESSRTSIALALLEEQAIAAETPVLVSDLP